MVDTAALSVVAVSAVVAAVALSAVLPRVVEAAVVAGGVVAAALSAVVLWGCGNSPTKDDCFSCCSASDKTISTSSTDYTHREKAREGGGREGGRERERGEHSTV